MRALKLVLLLGLAACQPKPLEVECTADADCGESAICEEGGTCRAVECLNTHDCVFGTYCDEDYACSEGCGSDLDCAAGETCEDNVCEAYGCRDTQLDCPLGQYCEAGTCLEDDRGHCTRCNINNNNSCGSNGECVYFSGPSCNTADDCEPGWACDNLGAGKICHLDTCIIECNPNAALTCPRGLDCVEGALLYDNRAFCVGDCPYLISEGAF